MLMLMGMFHPGGLELKSYFSEIEDEIAFIAKDRAYIVDEGKDIYNGEISTETINEVLKMLKKYDYPELVVCGKNGAYVHASVSDEFYQQTLRYYHKLSRITDFEKIDDIIFKFATSFPAIKDAAMYITGSNNNEGVLEAIDLIINKKSPFY